MKNYAARACVTLRTWLDRSRNTSDVAEHIAIFSVFKNAHINHIEHFHSICQNHTPVTFFQSTKDIIDKSVVCL